MAAQIDLDQSHVILVDFPTSKRSCSLTCYQIKKLLESMLIFINHKVIIFLPFQQETILNGTMRFLLKKGPFDLKKHGDDLAKYRGWTEETIDFMSKVFFELGFCYNGTMDLFL